MNLHVFKDARGRWRWTSYSSSAYEDRDQEIVSTRALSDDCDRADRDGSYGPLLWWHAPALALGDCDFNAMHGRILVESGTFRSDAIAQKVARAADGLGVSIGFVSPALPRAGVWHRIQRIERSILPLDRASNRLTGFHVFESMVQKELSDMATLKEQWSTAKQVLGLTDDDLLALQDGAEAREAIAKQIGLQHKAVAPVKRQPIARDRKADDGLDPLDQAYVQLRDALDAEDADGVQTALAQLTQLVGNSIDQSATKAARRDPLVAAIQAWCK